MAKRTKEEQAEYSRKYMEARRVANLRLIATHKDEFAQFLTEERERLGIPLILTPSKKEERRIIRIAKLEARPRARW